MMLSFLIRGKKFWPTAEYHGLRPASRGNRGNSFTRQKLAPYRNASDSPKQGCYAFCMTAVEVAAELTHTLQTARATLLAITEHAANQREDGKWSRKEILGHLIDSAANNHQRFVRLQHEEVLVLPGYRQSDWVRTQNYAAREWHDLVELWLAYNRHLAHIIRQADAGAVLHVWKGPSGDVHLQFLIEDYLHHLRHHLEQIVAPSA
jgi:DinB family protein